VAGMASLQARQLEAIQQMMLQQQGKIVCEFKAGKLDFDGASKMVTADPRRGTFLVRESADGITRIQWKTRPGNNVETTLVVIPNDISVEKVPECKDGRVFLLRMRSVNRLHFFWMQEPSDSKDDELLDKMKTAFASSNAPGGGGMVPGLGGAAGGDASSAMQQLVQQFISQQQGGAGAAPASSSANQLAMQQMQQMRAFSLRGIVSQSQLIMSSLDDDAKKRLCEFLPAGQKDEKGLAACLDSAQLKQGAGRLTRVLNSAQYGNLVTSFGLRNKGDMGAKAFIDAINEKYGKKTEEKKSEKKEEKDDPDKPKDMETE